MKRFLRKKLPSFILAVVMIVSMIPAASAAVADVFYAVDAGDTVTFDAYDFYALKSFDYLVFTDYSDLDAYGYFTSYNKAGNKVSLDESDLDNLWFYYNSSAIEYADDCDLDSLIFVADSDAEGTLTLDFELYRSSSSTPRYTGVLEIEISGGETSSGKITYKVTPGKETAFSSRDFYNFFEANVRSSSSSLSYVVFDRPASSAFSNGTLYYDYGKNTEEYFTRSSLAGNYFYYNPIFATEAYEYPLDKISFVAERTFSDSVELPFTAYGSGNKQVSGTLVLSISGSSSASDVDGDIVYSIEADDEIRFDHEDFKNFYDSKQTGTFSHICFTDITNLDACGTLSTYAYDDRDDSWDEVLLDEYDALDGYFFYRDDDVTDTTDYYCLDGMGFASAKNTDGEIVVLEFTAYGTNNKKAYGTLVLEIGDVSGSGSSDTTAAAEGDITYYVDSEEELIFDAEDFYDFYDTEASSGQLSYVRFISSKNLKSANGTLYYRYGYRNEESFSANSLYDNYFYYNSDDVPQDDLYAYPLEDLSFVAAEDFDTPVTLTFRAYRSSSKYEEGTLVINPEDLKNSTGTDTATGSVLGNIQYSATACNAVQIKASDISRLIAFRNCPSDESWITGGAK